jgi:hypothetical protein
MGHLDMKLWRARVVLQLGTERAMALFDGYPQGIISDREGLASTVYAAPQLPTPYQVGGGNISPQRLPHAMHRDTK